MSLPIILAEAPSMSLTESVPISGPFRLLEVVVAAFKIPSAADTGLGAIFDIGGKPASPEGFLANGFVGGLSGNGGKALVDDFFFSLYESLFDDSLLPLLRLGGGFGDPPCFATSNDSLTCSGVVPKRSRALREDPAKVTSFRVCGMDKAICFALSNSDTVSQPDLADIDVGGDSRAVACTAGRCCEGVVDGGSK